MPGCAGVLAIPLQQRARLGADHHTAGLDGAFDPFLVRVIPTPPSKKNGPLTFFDHRA